MVDRERSKNRHHLDKGEVVQALGEVGVKFQKENNHLKNDNNSYRGNNDKCNSVGIGGTTRCARVLLN